MPDSSEITGTPNPEVISARLQSYLTQRSLGARLSDFAFLASGAESDIYTFTFQPDGGPDRALILRLYQGDDISTKVRREADGLERLRLDGFPVPALFSSETNPLFLGRPFAILEKLEGTSLWPVLAGAPPAQAMELLDRFAGLIAQLHHLDWRPFSGQAARFEANPGALLDHFLLETRDFYLRMGVPGFCAVLDWLEGHKSGISVRPAVVHLDLHANNVFLCPDGRMAVIDWSQISVADFRMDLSWTLMIMGDFGQPGWRERILQAYQQQAWPVADLPYFEVMADLKLLASTIISLKTGPAALGLHPETYRPAAEQAPLLRRLSGRIRQVTGLSISDVEAALK